MKTITIIKGKLSYKNIPFKDSVFIDLMSGFFPKVLKRNFCKSRGLDCRLCDLSEKCVYSYIYEPPLLGEKSLVVSLPDIKIPFAFKWYFGSTDGEFNLSLFGRCSDYLFEIIQTLILIGDMGLGQEKMKYKIESLYLMGVDLNIIKELGFKREELIGIKGSDIERIKEISQSMPSLNMKIKMESDFDLVRSKRDIQRDEIFSMLYRRIRDRMKALFVIYLDEELPEELKGLSVKTRDIINLSNTSDIFEFKGNLSHFRFLFLLGSYFNIGRRCAFGKGAYKIIY